MNDEKRVEGLISLCKCPDCGGKLRIDWSPCYDDECCGIDDTIECENCNFSKDGRFLYATDANDFSFLEAEPDKDRKRLTDVEERLAALERKFNDLTKDVYSVKKRLG